MFMGGFTLGPACVNFVDHVAGFLDPGKEAVSTVLAVNPHRIAPEEDA